MRKLKLALEELAVESFPIALPAEEDGTVLAFAQTQGNGRTCGQQLTCGTMQTCAGPSCQDPCIT
ncbi:MAG TPA: hypothetical protein VFX98_09845 [Longimicrobiaceae bacterium]|nr:hypothetical protein [Longimicrobiaceae bacterium]